MEKGQGVLFIATIVMMIANVFAYFAGMEVWLGWNWLVSLGALLIAAFFLGDLAGIAVSIIAFIGAWKGWGWAWWQAFLLCFPSLALMAVMMAAGGLKAAAGRLAGQH